MTGFEAWEHINKTSVVLKEIMEHVKAIRVLEKELVSLNTDDICEDFDLHKPIQGQSLWRNLERIEKRSSSYAQTQQQFDEDPCYSTLDLVVQKLLHTPKSPLLLKGCSIHSLGKSVQFCISGEVDGSVFGQNHG